MQALVSLWASPERARRSRARRQLSREKRDQGELGPPKENRLTAQARECPQNRVHSIARYAHTFALQPADVVDALGLDIGGRYGIWLAPDRRVDDVEPVGFTPRSRAAPGQAAAQRSGRPWW